MYFKIKHSCHYWYTSERERGKGREEGKADGQRDLRGKKLRGNGPKQFMSRIK